MYVLDKLWRGEITPSEKSTYRDSEYHAKLRELCEIADRLNQELTEQGREYFKTYGSIQAQLDEIENRETFIEAFRLGAGLLLDVVGERKCQFYT